VESDHRLSGALVQVDDAESTMTKTDPPTEPEAFSIGTAMGEPRRHRSYEILGDRTARVDGDLPGESAHLSA
jgi:hypothetical protein